MAMSFWVTVVVRLGVAGAALYGFRAWMETLPSQPSVWTTAIASFALVKLAGDAVTATLLRRSLVFFYEDMFWELVAFVALGALAGGLIVLVQNLIGGPVRPYFPSVVVYLVYMLAEGRQSTGREGGVNP